MNHLLPVLRQYPFLIPLVVLVLSEVTKAIVSALHTGVWHERLFLPGGFPSTHSAFVTSLLIVVSHLRGIGSVEFAIAFVVAAITWYDSIFVRRELGMQAHVLNQLQKSEHLRERLGHSLLEVMAGIAFGALITEIGIRVG